MTSPEIGILFVVVALVLLLSGMPVAFALGVVSVAFMLGFMPPANTAPDQWQPPGEPNLYFFVSDVDAVFAKLSAEGVLFDQPPTDMPWGHRLAILRDPEGRRVCLAQNLQR